MRGVLIVLLAACTSSTAPDPQAVEWSRTYLADLGVARDTITSNHPGVADRDNPAFGRTLGAAYEEARRAASDVVDYDSYRVALTRFANQFQDAHLAISFKKPFESLRDAGIITTYRGDTFVVAGVDERYGSKAVEIENATLISCDGISAREHFKSRLLSWRGRAPVEADWHILAPILFVDYGPPAPGVPSRCRFDAGGRTVDLALSFRETTQDRVSQLLELQTGEDRDLSLERLADGVVWVNVPTFAVSDENSIAAMRSLIDDFRTEVSRNDWRLIVFDLRGNSGGSSSWGRQFATALFGADWTRGAMQWLSDGVYTEWRVSPENVDAVAGHVRQAEQRHGAESEAAKENRAFHQTMSNALARGDVFWSIPRSRTGLETPQPVPLPGRIAVITGPSCFSACLDFLDVMRLHPAVVHAGHITGVDTVYMENWGKPLPSGLARISYPMKVYRNRRRGNNEAYVPHLRYPASLHDSAALRGWILESLK
jgi:hypothetical protein